MKIILDEKMLKRYVQASIDLSPKRPILIEKFLESATEAEADTIADGTDAFVPTVMELIEYAGIHSGDSACVVPPVAIPEKHLTTIEAYTKKIAVELNIVGLMNIRYAIAGDTVFVLEANPRASRTVPLITKVFNIPMARLATQIILGKNLRELRPERKAIQHFGVKEAVFPFNMLPEVDPVLGPEMRSTGEVLGLAESFGLAYYKSQAAAGASLPLEGSVLITVADRDKQDMIEPARRFKSLGFSILATAGTKRFLEENGVPADSIWKMHEGRPHIIDEIKNDNICLIINTPHGKVSEQDDSHIRKSAVRYQIPYITTASAAMAAAAGIEARKKKELTVKSLQEYHAGQ